VKGGNPWLRVAAADYDGHMAHDSVAQTSLLADCFGHMLAERKPRRVALLGCATGNGLEHVDPDRCERVLGVDLNPDYLALAAERHGGRLGEALVLREADLGYAAAAAAILPPERFDLVHAALLFEYLDPAALLPVLAATLAADGVLSVLLQMPVAGKGAVSESPHVEGVSILEPLLKLVPPERFAAAAREVGLERVREEELRSSAGKGFHFSVWRRAPK